MLFVICPFWSDVVRLFQDEDEFDDSLATTSTRTTRVEFIHWVHEVWEVAKCFSMNILILQAG